MLNIENYRESRETLLELHGRNTKDDIAKIRRKVQEGRTLRLEIEGKEEKCKVLFKSYLNFTVQRKNYKENFTYTDVMLGNIKILSMGECSY